MRTARILFVERIAKFVEIIPKSATLVHSGDTHRYRVYDFETGKIDYSKSLYIWVDKLKSGRYSIKIKQEGSKWEKGKLKDLQESFNPMRVQVKQRFYKTGGVWRINVINLYSDHLLW